MRDLLRHRSFVLGLILTGGVVLMALVSLFWTPFPPEQMQVSNRLQGFGSGENVLGTDRYGRDILSMLMVGAGNSMIVGVVAVGIGLLVGVPLGLMAALRAGLLDNLVSRFVDLAFAFPAILSAILITAFAGPGAVNSMIAIGIFNIAVFARVTRGAALGVQAREFVRAAGALGRSRFDLTIHHILPNLSAVLIVQATIQFAIAILAEAGLSYLGLGTQPPNPSWGKMLLEAQTLIFLDPWQAIPPGLAIALTVLGLNLLGDGLRDGLDPRLRVMRVG